MTQGKFIVIEGLEGAGKTSARDHILQILTDHGIQEVVQTREPGGTIIAEKLRNIVLAKNEERDDPLQDISELLLMYASRVQLVENVIKPSLAQGKWVLGDRHDFSSQAYQGGGRELGKDRLQQLKALCLGDFKPDLTLYLDVEPKTGLTRARGRGELDRIEKMDIEFFHRTRARFLELSEQDPNSVIIDANQSQADVLQDISNCLANFLG